MKTLIVSPTYNERKNISRLVEKVFSVESDYHLLIVDDNSPDGTGDLVTQLQKKYPNLFLEKRAEKAGLGTAYCTGFKWALERDYDLIIQMDADLSHNPDDIIRMMDKAKSADLIIGSRYIEGVNVINWPMSRLLLSYFANWYVRFLIRFPIKDSTGGYKCFRRRVLQSIDLNNIRSEGYSFQIEMNLKAYVKGFTVKEIPIIFNDRALGTSKMSKKVIFEAIYMVPLLKIQQKIMSESPNKLWIILFRRAMIRLASMIADEIDAPALVSGESVGQVASQTLSNIRATSDAADRPIIRPLGGSNKEDIVRLAEKIGTYEISIEPYDDCCSFFVPIHPETKADLKSVKKIENQIDFGEMFSKALDDSDIIEIDYPDYIKRSVEKLENIND